MSAIEEEVLGIGKKLEKFVEQGQADNSIAMDNLKKLKEIPITLDILQKTRIGMSVNVLRKASSKDELQGLAKTLIKNWKKLLDNQDKAKAQKDSQTLQRTSSDSNMSSSSQSNITQAASAISQNSSNGSKSGGNKNTTKPMTFPPIKGDVAVRQRCREMLESSLKTDGDPVTNITDLAAHIEEAIFMEFKDSGSKYKNRVKSRVMNLRDKNNPNLKLKILHGDLSAERFAVMKPEEMASEDMKKARNEMTKQAIKDHQLATTGGTGTDQFKCSKCGKRNCTYNQVQTRSADEPMTTFVLCNECGKRWKFC